MGSFGETDSREVSPAFSTHPPETPIGFVWFGASRRANRYRLPLSSFGLGASRRANRYKLPLGSFGLGGCGEPIATDYHWVRLVRGSRGANRYKLPLGSFGFGASRRANRYRLPLGSFGLGASRRANRYRLPLGSFGLGASRRANRYRLPLGSFGLGGCGEPIVTDTIGFVWFGASRGANRYRLPLGSFGHSAAGFVQRMVVHRYELSKSGGGDASIFITSQNVAKGLMKPGNAPEARPIGLGTLEVAPTQTGKPRMASQRLARS